MVSKKSNVFFFSTRIITDRCIIHQNKIGLLWITFQFHNIVTVSLSSSVLPSKESLYTCIAKSC